jgi:hemoglobin/transferrin/lactoferrin receptor protein
MKKVVLSYLGILSAYATFAQDSIPQKQEEVKVTAYRFAESWKKVPFTTKKISNKEWNMNAPTTADILQNSGAVLVQKSQAGGGSPIIRGFEASRVLLLVDGIRMNNAIYRSGHLQNVITVDGNSLSAIEILFGPASTQFGSDALGGVINMITKNPTVSTNSKTFLTGNINSRYSSAVNELQTHADINIGSKQWASLSSITYSTFGDVVQGDKRDSKYPDFGKKGFYVNTVSGNDYMVANTNVNKQVVTAYKQVDFLQKIKYTPKQGVEHLFNFQYSTTSDVPRYDRLTEVSGGLPRFGEWYYGPQERLLTAYHFNKENRNAFFQKIQSTIAYQRIKESRFDRRFNNKNKNNRVEEVNIVSYTLDALRKKGNVESHTGMELQLNKVNSTAFSQNIVTGVKQNNITTRYPDGKNKMNSVAAYYQLLYNLNSNSIISGGVRFTQVGLSSIFVNNTVAQFPFNALKQNNGAVSGNIGITHNTKSNWKLSALLSTGFRAPNFDELKVFDSRAGFLIVPNENIKPEYTYNAEVNANKIVGDFQLGVALFYTYLQNAIQIDNYNLNGTTNVIYQGVPSIIQAAQNVGKATVYGSSINAKYTIQEKTAIEGSLTFTKGKVNKPTKVPLDHIPPMYGKIGIKHNETKWNAELFALFNGAKKLADYSPSGEDNLQYATIDGMPSWYTINLRTQYHLNAKLYLQFGIENIADKNYRVFASGISAPGRNYVIALRANF